MTREEFIEKHRLALGGMLLEAVRTRESGQPLYFLLDKWTSEFKKILGEAWDDLHKKEEPPGPIPAKLRDELRAVFKTIQSIDNQNGKGKK